MAFQFPLVSFVLLAATGLAAASGATAWRHREVPGSAAFVGMMAVVALWALTYGVQLLFTSFERQLFFGALQYPFGLLSPIAFLVFVLYYTGREEWVTRPRLLAAVAFPLVVALVVWIPQLQWLVRADAVLAQPRSHVMLDVSYGPLFMLVVGYSYLFMLAGVGLLVLRALKTSAFYRYQSLLITVGALVPVAGSVGSYVLGLTVVDLTPVGLSVFGVTVVLALTRFRLLEVSPVARDRVITEVSDGILVTNTHGRIVDINPAARRILDVEESIGTPLSEVASDRVAPLLEVAAGESTELVVPGETDRYYQCRKTTVTDPSQSGRIHIYILHEVTERRAREEWFRSLTEYYSGAICVLDGDLRVSYVSPSVERVLGYDPDAVVGESFLACVHGDDADRVRETLHSGTGGPARLTYRARTADGAWRTLQSRSKNRLSDPVVEGIIVNIRDITEMESRKEQLRRKNERLDTFASVVSHDLRNPLNVASGRAALLRGVLDDDPETAQHLDSLEDALDRMESIIDDTLTLAREGQASLDLEPIELGEWIGECWAMVETADATLEPVDDAVIRGDPDQLQQLFENLFRNAVEHGGETVTVRVGGLDGGFYVADDGPGIAPERRETVFETGGASGDGSVRFGLPIVKRIAEIHGWNVRITESDGGGARFEFTGVDTLDERDPTPERPDGVSPDGAHESGGEQAPE